MYKKVIYTETSLGINESTEGERIEKQIEKLLNSGDDVNQGQTRTVLYTERDKGVIGDYDIRADKFEQAINDAEVVTSAMRGKNDKRREERENKVKEVFENQKGTDSSATSKATE